MTDDNPLERQHRRRTDFDTPYPHNEEIPLEARIAYILRYATEKHGLGVGEMTTFGRLAARLYKERGWDIKKYSPFVALMHFGGLFDGPQPPLLVATVDDLIRIRGDGSRLGRYLLAELPGAMLESYRHHPSPLEALAVLGAPVYEPPSPWPPVVTAEELTALRRIDNEAGRMLAALPDEAFEAIVKGWQQLPPSREIAYILDETNPPEGRLVSLLNFHFSGRPTGLGMADELSRLTAIVNALRGRCPGARVDAFLGLAMEMYRPNDVASVRAFVRKFRSDGTPRGPFHVGQFLLDDPDLDILTLGLEQLDDALYESAEET